MRLNLRCNALSVAGTSKRAVNWIVSLGRHRSHRLQKFVSFQSIRFEIEVATLKLNLNDRLNHQQHDEWFAQSVYRNNIISQSRCKSWNRSTISSIISIYEHTKTFSASCKTKLSKENVHEGLNWKIFESCWHRCLCCMRWTAKSL